jgi:hypothetical protein
MQKLTPHNIKPGFLTLSEQSLRMIRFPISNLNKMLLEGTFHDISYRHNFFSLTNSIDADKAALRVPADLQQFYLLACILLDGW